jgi:hypothetical protein
MATGIGTTPNLVQLQSTNLGQPNTQYVTLDINNRAQVISLPQQSGQYITVPSGSFQVLPLQGATSSTQFVQGATSSAQFVQLQVPNFQQSGTNFIQLQAAPTNQQIQTQNKGSATQTFIPVQHILAANSQQGTNQKVSIQLVQQQGAQGKAIPVSLSQNTVVSIQKQSLVGIKTIGESTSSLTTSLLKQQDQQNTNSTILTSTLHSAGKSSSVFNALQQAGMYLYGNYFLQQCCI